MKYFLVMSALLLTFVLVSEACDCDYHSGGCVISQAPDAGSKCKCVYKGGWTCSGFSVGCEGREDCPGGCTTQSCCNTGGGDCGGY